MRYTLIEFPESSPKKGQYFGPYDTKQEALDDARRRAEQSRGEVHVYHAGPGGESSGAPLAGYHWDGARVVEMNPGDIDW